MTIAELIKNIERIKELQEPKDSIPFDEWEREYYAEDYELANLCSTELKEVEHADD